MTPKHTPKAAHEDEPKAKVKPKAFGDALADLDYRLGVAVAKGDGDAIDGLYRELDGLKPSGPAEELAYLALARLFAHHAPRKSAD